MHVSSPCACSIEQRFDRDRTTMIGRCDIFVARVLLHFEDHVVLPSSPPGAFSVISVPAARQQVGNGHASPDKLALCPGLAKL
jgi:hypothetical protein